MTGWQTMILVAITAILAVVVWAGFQFRQLSKSSQSKKPKSDQKGTAELAEEDVNHLFNREFREELRNRGRLRFESIVNENAMFLKQDLDITISQLNEYIKQVIQKKLDEEFAAYEKAIKDARELAISSLQKSTDAVEQQREEMKQALAKHAADRETNLVKAFEENMAQIIEHYLLESLGQQFDLKTRLPYIISQ